MKSKQAVLSKMFCILAELEHGVKNVEIEKMLRSQLRLIYEDILDEEDIEEEYWERIENNI